jgi:3-hydroxybutyryl-CoA dehydratase
MSTPNAPSEERVEGIEDRLGELKHLLGEVKRAVVGAQGRGAAARRSAQGGVMTGLTIEELSVGDVAQATRKITADSIREFVGATGDRNPIHSDVAFAATTRFGQIIAPGLLTGGLLSALIGTRLPGPGAIYLSQSFRFLRPVHVGDTLTARVEVTEILLNRNRVCLRTVCVNQDGQVVLEGEAWVMPGKAHVDYDEAAAHSTLGGLPWAPAALGMQAFSFWMTGVLALATHALDLYRPRPAPSS